MLLKRGKVDMFCIELNVTELKFTSSGSLFNIIINYTFTEREALNNSGK